MKIAICLRVYSGVSKCPVVGGTKYETFMRCFNSLVAGFPFFQFVDLTILFDRCPPAFREGASAVLKNAINVEYSLLDSISNGNTGTFREQLKILESKTTDYLLFLEDDYLFVEDWPKFFINLISKEVVPNIFITGFRSNDYDVLSFHRYFSSFRKPENQVSTTLTFFTTPKVLAETRIVFETFLYGNFDNVLWLYLTDKYAIYRLLLEVINLRTKKSLSKLFKYFKFYKNCKRYFLIVPNTSFMVHLEQNGFPIDMRYLIQDV